MNQMETLPLEQRMVLVSYKYPCQPHTIIFNMAAFSLVKRQRIHLPFPIYVQSRQISCCLPYSSSHAFYCPLSLSSCPSSHHLPNATFLLSHSHSRSSSLSLSLSVRLPLSLPSSLPLSLPLAPRTPVQGPVSSAVFFLDNGHLPQMFVCIRHIF
jgi:hypothetical protein